MSAAGPPGNADGALAPAGGAESPEGADPQAGLFDQVVVVRRAVNEELADGGKLALYEPSTGLVVLNAGASSIWRLLDGSRTLRQVVAELARAYDVSLEDLRNDVWATYRHLHSLRLVETRPRPEDPNTHFGGDGRPRHPSRTE